MNTDIESAHEIRSAFKEDGSIPVLRGLPGIGVALQLHKNPMNFFSETIKCYGDRVELRVLGRRVLLLTNPADVETVLAQNAEDFGRSPEVKALRAVFGDGVYSSEGERWRKQRRVVQPAFHHDLIMKHCSTMVSRMTARVNKWSHGDKLDILNEMIGFTTDVICEVVFGKEQSTDAKSVANSVSVVFENLRAEILYLSLWRRLPFPRNRRWNLAIKSLDIAINNAIAERRSSKMGGEDLLGVLLGARDESGRRMSSEYVHDEVITMFVAGQETSAVALFWAIVLLAENPQFQEEAVAEIAQVTNGRAVMAEDYPRLRFLNAAVQETVRLYPPLWCLGRRAIRDSIVGDLRISKGTDVWIPVRQIQRDARWFSEPDRFNPYRWNGGAQRPKFSYFPFGGGQRSCIAQHFAMAELGLGLAVMLSRFRFRFEAGAKVEMDPWLTLRPKKRVHVAVSSR
jgi:cytochrome P450